jgi:hypothetical protein
LLLPLLPALRTNGIEASPASRSALSPRRHTALKPHTDITTITTAIAAIIITAAAAAASSSSSRAAARTRSGGEACRGPHPAVVGSAPHTSRLGTATATAGAERLGTATAGAPRRLGTAAAFKTKNRIAPLLTPLLLLHIFLTKVYCALFLTKV